MADQIAFKDKEVFSLSLLVFGFQKNTIVCKNHPGIQCMEVAQKNY